jgi:hypothetical protein
MGKELESEQGGVLAEAHFGSLLFLFIAAVEDCLCVEFFAV